MNQFKIEISNANPNQASNLLLSPFTWSNLKLPLINKQRPVQVNQHKPKQQHLQSIKQKKKVSEQLKHSGDNKKPKSNRKHQTTKTNEISMQANFKSIESGQTKLNKTLIQPKDGGFRTQKAKSYMNKLNKTIEVVRTEEKGARFNDYKKIRYLDHKNNMEGYMKKNLIKAGWEEQQDNQKNAPGLLWANIGKANDFNDIREGQFYNHLNGSVNLTNKDKLHEHLSVYGRMFYPKSFLIPKQYQSFASQNNKVAIKCMLCQISKQILHFLKSPLDKVDLFEITLDEILQSSIMKIANEEINLLVKLCSYLQSIRIQSGLTHYFQKFSSYRNANLHIKDNFYDKLLSQAYHYLEKKSSEYLKFSFHDVDYRFIILLLHYHQLFSENDASYNQNRNIWIIKPIASSRGAGISLVQSSKQLCNDPESMFFWFKNRKKYENKIIQQYVPNPLLLKSPAEFQGKKFDVRHWVLVTSNNNKPQIYKYHTAYCRFSNERFTLDKLDKEIHLTNYSIFKQANQNNENSIMMIEDLFTNTQFGDLRNKYHQQADFIIKETIIKCKSIKYQRGCFELFGFDFFIDQHQKLSLLEINLNPSCDSQRHPWLKKEAEIMSTTMISLVTQSKPTDKWIKIYGNKRNLDENQLNERTSSQDVQIKPYYQTNIDKESFIGLIKQRQKALFWISYLSEKFTIYECFDKMKPDHLKTKKKVKEQLDTSQRHSQKGLIKFIEQNSVTNLSVN